MKKKLIALVALLTLMVVTVSASSNTFELTQVYYPIYTRGKLVAEDDLPVLSYNDRTYVPLRKLSEASGLSVVFDDTTDSIYLENIPLFQAKTYAMVTDAANHINETYMMLDSFMDSCSLSLNYFDIHEYADANRVLLKSAQVIDMVQLKIESLSTKISTLQKSYESLGYILGDSPVDKLASCRNNLNDALIDANTSYNLIYALINGDCSVQDFSAQYYGDSGSAVTILLNMNSARTLLLDVYAEYSNKIQGL